MGRGETRNGRKETLIEWKEQAMTENAKTPGQDKTPGEKTDQSKWVRVELPKDAIAQESITAQEIVKAMREARQEWLERVIRNGGTPPPSALHE